MHDVAIMHLFYGHAYAVYHILAKWLRESLPRPFLPQQRGKTAAFHLGLYQVKAVLMLENVDACDHKIARQPSHEPYLVDQVLSRAIVRIMHAHRKLFLIIDSLH